MNESKFVPLPLFRSDAQFGVLGELYTTPGLEATVGELAERIGVSHPTVSREVRRLTEAGLLRTRSRGRQTVVSAETSSPVYEDLRNLLTKVYGVLPTLREVFAGVAQRVVVFGSWAARWAGEPGPVPRDVDVLVVSDAPAASVWDAAARATRALGVDVNVVVRSPHEWASEHSGFASELRRRPSLEVEVPSASAPPPATHSADVRAERRWG